MQMSLLLPMLEHNGICFQPVIQARISNFRHNGHTRIGTCKQHRVKTTGNTERRKRCELDRKWKTHPHEIHENQFRLQNL
ncbi:hypothetical protein EUGRSUZ_K01279 [Eucalyptus grandis]|uniref:Uncharacterized protein n=2 Tax=Eucalyptus grandis TaxID=71139 RepID=A0ACC3IT17_EUCGR|nr:hypothetical protein EUGRSUZ_K01279 [Eucalyptus grandis]